MKPSQTSGPEVSPHDCVRAARRLKQSLLDERAALSKRDAAALEAAVDAKTRDLRAFAELLSARSARSLDELANGLLTDEAAWQDFAALAAECEQLNAGNGAAIRLRQRHVEQGIALLRGGESQTETYGPRGTADGGSGSRPLLEA